MRRLFLFLLILFPASAAVSPANALPVDLTSLDIYVREGFDPAWVSEGPHEDIVAESQKQSGEARWIKSDTARWLWIKGHTGDRSVRVIDLGLSSVPSRPLFSLGIKPVVCTYCISFPLSAEDFSSHALGLYLPQIGQNWEVYLNGTLVKSELHTAADGSIRRDRSVRDQVVELPSSLLKNGTNLLGFRIVGDPTADRTGFFMKRGYSIDRYDLLQSHKREYIDMALIGTYIFFGLYHLILFVRRRKDSCNLSFGCAAILLSVYYLSRTSISYQFIPDTRIIKTIELFSLIMMISSFTFFFDQIVRGKATLFTRGYFIYSILCALLVIPFEREILYTWQIILIAPLLYTFVFDIIMPLSAQIRQIRSSRARKGLFSFLSSISDGFLSTIPGNLAIGVGVVMVTGLLEVISVKSGGTQIYVKYVFSLLVLGIVVILANRFLRIHTEVEELNLTLEHKVEDRTKELKQANEEIGAAMEELASINDALTMTNRELEEAQRIAAMDLDIAARVQASFFPKHSPKADDWDIAFAFKPLAGVSGDLYDFYHRDDRFWGVSLLDVSGHGIASGLITLLARSVISRRFMAGGGEKLNRVVEQINHDLVSEIGNVDHYLTGIVIRVDGDHIEYVNAGHPDLLFRKGDTGEVKAVDPKGKNFRGNFLGIADMESHYNMITFRMLRDDMIFLYSDCLSEGMSYTGEEFGQERIMKSFQSAPKSGSSHQILEYIIHDYLEFVGSDKLQDDLTAVLIRRNR